MGAYVYAKERRPCVNPNVGFWRQLQDFQDRQTDKLSPTPSAAFDANWIERSIAMFNASDSGAFEHVHELETCERVLETAMDYVFGRGFIESDLQWLAALVHLMPNPSSAHVCIDGILDHNSTFMENWSSDVTDNDLARLKEALALN